MEYEKSPLGVDPGMSLYACASAEVNFGNRQNPVFAGLLAPTQHEVKFVEKNFVRANEQLEDVTIWLPRNTVISDFTISIDDDAVIQSPTPYKYPPMLYYGSSITEGGCCCRVTNAYNAIISRHLDVDYYNLGFSGRAKGEREVAEFIADIPMSIFVLDYDHNAPSIEHLQATHETFFKIIRAKNPNLPIVMLTRPNFDHGEKNDVLSRIEVVKKTYLNAKANGDNNVYFISGETFFGEVDRQSCTVDGTHPNDLGFYRMASVIEPVIKEILEEKFVK
jgi:hypothetical protein